jgi:hypothetical protein
LKPAAARLLRPGVEEGKTVKESGGLVTGGKRDQDVQVAQSVLDFVAQMRSISKDIRFEASTYHGHSGLKSMPGDSPYTLDVSPNLQKDERGFYAPPEQMIEFFRRVDQAARATGVEWKALYNDFAVASRVNKELGVEHIGFQWTHGPAPAWVLHVHFTIMPKAGSVPELRDRAAGGKPGEAQEAIGQLILGGAAAGGAEAAGRAPAEEPPGEEKAPESQPAESPQL